MNTSKQWYNHLLEAFHCVKIHIEKATTKGYNKISNSIIEFVKNMKKSTFEIALEKEMYRICENPKYIDLMTNGLFLRLPKNFAPGVFFKDPTIGFTISDIDSSCEVKFKEIIICIGNISLGSEESVKKGEKVNMFFCDNISRAFISFISRETTSIPREKRESILKNTAKSEVVSPHEGMTQSAIKVFLMSILENPQARKFVNTISPGAADFIKGTVDKVDTTSMGEIAIAAQDSFRSGNSDLLINKASSIATELFSSLQVDDKIDPNDQE